MGYFFYFFCVSYGYLKKNLAKKINKIDCEEYGIDDEGSDDVEKEAFAEKILQAKQKHDEHLPVPI